MTQALRFYTHFALTRGEMTPPELADPLLMGPHGEPFGAGLKGRWSGLEMAEAEFPYWQYSNPLPPWGSVMVGTGSSGRLGITRSNSHIVND